MTFFILLLFTPLLQDGSINSRKIARNFQLKLIIPPCYQFKERLLFAGTLFGRAETYKRNKN
jgi:hypothetical protein